MAWKIFLTLFGCVSLLYRQNEEIYNNAFFGIKINLPTDIQRHRLSQEHIWIGWHSDIVIPSSINDGRMNDLIVIMPFTGSMKQKAQEWASQKYIVTKTDTTIRATYIIRKHKTSMNITVYQKYNTGIIIYHFIQEFWPALEPKIEERIIQYTQLTPITKNNQKRISKVLVSTKIEWMQQKADSTLYVPFDDGWGVPTKSDVTLKKWIETIIGSEIK